MKKLLILTVVASLSFWGCSESTNLTEPTDVQSSQAFLKISNSEVSELSIEAKSALELEIGTALAKTQSDSNLEELIDGKKGGKINFELSEGDFASVGVLKFKGNSFDGVEEITIAMDLSANVAALEFGPDKLDLSKPAKLTVAYMGLDIENGEEVFFKYITDNGALEEVEHSGIIVGDGWALVKNAKIEHFSRFGFTK